MEQKEKYFSSQQTKKDLENLERYVEEFSAFLPLAVCTLNPAGVITDLNQRAKDLIGYSETDIVGQEIEFLFQDKDLTRKFFEQVLKKKSIRNQEMILVTRDKRKIPVNISASLRRDRQNNVIGCFLAITDISRIKEFQGNLEKKVRERTKDLENARTALTNMLEDTEKARRKIEEEQNKTRATLISLENTRTALTNMLEDTEEARRNIEEEQNKTRATLISLIDGLIVFDREKKITLVNPEAEKILELQEKQVLNKKIDQVSGFSNLTQLYQALGQEIEWTGQKYDLVLKKPLERFFQVSITPVVVKKEIVGLMVILHDITREKEVDRLKTEFVSIAAHQLRTPLSAIKWTLRMLLDGDVGQLSKEQVEFLVKGYQSNERMITLINDLLNVARIEEGRFLYGLTLQSLEEIIEKVLTGLDALIKKKKLKLVFIKPKSSLPKIKVDREKISLVVQNLLDNAIRFNREGGKVTVTIKYDKMNIEVMIKDTGIGIPSLQQNRIFAKFFRASNVIESDTEGTGLGLFICKNIIEAHEGKIWFESKENQGTTFWFTLPIKQ